ncbi:MAG: hypothetical protein JXR56_06970 [Candidatus Cloacimonetes bacterium]|nr:hypothetical protein [Candidatus Cloacimonadota bacterium]
MTGRTRFTPTVRLGVKVEVMQLLSRIREKPTNMQKKIDFQKQEMIIGIDILGREIKRRRENIQCSNAIIENDGATYSQFGCI